MFNALTVRILRFGLFFFLAAAGFSLVLTW
jgi:hypothetical protein